MTQHFDKAGVLGAGAWGTALAAVLARAGRKPILWAREADVIENINTHRQNPRYLPDVELDAAIHATSDMTALGQCGCILAVIPAQYQRQVLGELKAHIAPGTVIVQCAKGIERGTGNLMSTVITDALPGATPAILSGPSFAADVVRGLPTAVTLAAPTLDIAEGLVAQIGIQTFRPYASDDMIGAQIGGAVKNVLAIACGIVDGCQLGTSARAAVTTRGFAEMNRLGKAMGARPETLAGLSGLGDLVLTCNSPLSRNYTLGAALGSGQTLEEAVAGGKGITEGVFSAEAVRHLAAQHQVEMPICEAIAQIVDGEISVLDAIMALLSRPFRPEV